MAMPFDPLNSVEWWSIAYMYGMQGASEAFNAPLYFLNAFSIDISFSNSSKVCLLRLDNLSRVHFNLVSGAESTPDIIEVNRW